jgi:lipopolysaccharide export LptBFGC system permease protein LptF
MFTTKKLNLVAPLAIAVLGITAASIQPAFASVAVPAPIIGAGLPVLAVLGGGYWLVKKLRERR